MFSTSRRGRRAVNVWPGFVDALSSLLIVVIFLLLIFIVAYLLLGEILSGQESELSSLHRQVAELTRLLGLQEQKNERLSTTLAELTGLVDSLNDTKRRLGGQVEALSRQVETDASEMQRQLATIASLQEDIDALRKVRAELEAKVGGLAEALQASQTQQGALRDRTKALETRLVDEEERTLLAQKEIENRQVRIQALLAVTGQQKEALEQQRQLTSSARAEITLLNRQIEALRKQLEEIGRALEVAEREKTAQAATIQDLGKRLNIALARRVNELERYRSEFFGRLREVLGDNPWVRIEGDRFLFQAELLFASGSAELGDQGRSYLARLAAVLKDLMGKIPNDINWILRIDGHTDRVPTHSERFASNWELSTARAVSVVRFLADQGIPEARMAAAGFSKFHPLDPADTPEAYRKNRRIEIKLTSR